MIDRDLHNLMLRIAAYFNIYTPGIDPEPDLDPDALWQYVENELKIIRRDANMLSNHYEYAINVIDAKDMEIDQLRAEVERLRGEYDHACGLVARMHTAAMGEIRGPVRGVEEDVEDVRLRAEKAEAQVAAVLALCDDGRGPGSAFDGYVRVVDVRRAMEETL